MLQDMTRVESVSIYNRTVKRTGFHSLQWCLQVRFKSNCWWSQVGWCLWILLQCGRYLPWRTAGWRWTRPRGTHVHPSGARPTCDYTTSLESTSLKLEKFKINIMRNGVIFNFVSSATQLRHSCFISTRTGMLAHGLISLHLSVFPYFF